MKNLRITESCIVSGQHTEAGTVLKNVDNSIAADLLVNGRAVIIHGDPEPEHRDPKPATTKKAAKAQPVEE